MRYELAKPDDYRREKEAVPIAYLPWGAHEWHGKHNALGLDTLKAHALCEELCAETGGVVFPSIYCGYNTMKPAVGFDSTLEFSKECVELMATEYLTQLADEGFKVIVLLAGHYGQLHMDALSEVVSDFNDAQHDAVAWVFADYKPIEDEGFAGDHAARGETSYMLYFHPELVDMSRLPLPSERELTIPEDGIAGVDPRTEASAKRGREAVNALVRNVVPKIVELLKGKTGQKASS